MKKIKEYWSMTEGVFNCLIDTERTIAFGKAIKNTVKNGDVVVDMGTGTGILAMLAVDAGAKKVYAVEFDKKNIQTLQKTFENNGYGEKIIIIHGDVTKISLPEKVNVIIGEMIATGLIEELQIQATNNMLKYAKNGAKVLLKEFENYIDLVNNNNNFYGKKFDVIRYEYPHEKDLVSDSFSEKKLYAKINFTKENFKNNIDSKNEIVIEKKGTINGVRISSKTIFDDGSTLNATPAYSYMIILPIKEIVVKKGDIFIVNISYNACEGFNTLKYSINKK